MILEEACHSLKLECALRDLGFVDIGWKCVAHAGIFFIQPVGFPDDPDGELLGFSLTLPNTCLLYTSPSPRDKTPSRMPSSA